MLRTAHSIIFVLTLLSATLALGDVVITTSGFPLLPNKANQVVTFQIATDSGTCDLTGFDLRLMVGDGGEFFGGGDIPAGETNPTTPAITGVDIDLLFGAGATANEVVTGKFDNKFGIAGLADADAVSGATGIATISTTPVDLFTVEFSTVGLSAGTDFDLTFLLGEGGDADETRAYGCTTSFDGISVPSSSTVAVPEPSSLLYLAFLGTALAGNRWRTRFWKTSIG